MAVDKMWVATNCESKRPRRLADKDCLHRSGWVLIETSTWEIFLDPEPKFNRRRRYCVSIDY